MSKTLPDLPPFRVPGSPDHINDHDLFDIWLAAVRDAFYPSPEYDFPAIPDPAAHGNPGHVEAHNRLRACAEYMKATDYASDSSFPPIPAEADEGNQGHVVAHNEFRDVFAYVAAHQPSRYNAATGGTVTDVENYNGTGQRWRVHTFTGSGTFTVQAADKPFRVLVVAGGGHGGPANPDGGGGGGGGGGHVADASRTITAGAHGVTVGNGSHNSIAFGLTANAGGGGGAGRYGGNGASGGCGGGGGYQSGSAGGSGSQGGHGGHSNGGYSGGGGGGGGNGGTPTAGKPYYDDITGSSTAYAGGGAGVDARDGRYFNGAQGAGKGGGGGGGSGQNNPGAGGSAGVVVVAYQIG